MANYFCSWRTNYFLVKNKEAFLEWAKSFSGVQVVAGRYDTVALLQSDEDEDGIPSHRIINDEDTDVDFFTELSAHLKDDEVAIVMESGAEKLRYIVGSAVAVNSKGDVLSVSLDNIYKLVKEKWGIKEVSPCEY